MPEIDVRTDVLIVGAGYAGLNAARELERRLAPGEARLLMVAPDNHMVIQPLLPEVASGSVDPRQAVIPLRQALRRTRFMAGRMVDLDAGERTVDVRLAGGEITTVGFRHAVIAVGARTKALPVPGLAEHAVGFSTVAEALHLRNAVMARLETAEATRDPEVRRRALTFVAVGAGYTGVEAIAEMADLASATISRFRHVTEADLRWLLVEATDRILPTMDPEMGAAARELLEDAGVEVRLETTVDEIDHDGAHLSDGEVVATDTIVWATGVAPSGVCEEVGMPVTDSGHVRVDRSLRVEGMPGVWSAGDCAAMPTADGELYPGTAQVAQRAGGQLGRNILAELRGQQLAPFAYEITGEMLALGRWRGLGHIKGRRVTGPLAWLARRAYYIAQMPTFERKARLALDWTVGAVFPADTAALGHVEDPERPLDVAVADQLEDVDEEHLAG